jgi:hypothetical protein
MMSEPQKGDLKVWWIPQVPGKAFEVPVASVEQGKFLTDALANYDLFQLEYHIKPDYCNAGGILRFDPADKGDDCDGWTDLDEDV